MEGGRSEEGMEGGVREWREAARKERSEGIEGGRKGGRDGRSEGGRSEGMEE